jgi:hypothetical protein
MCARIVHSHFAVGSQNLQEQFLPFFDEKIDFAVHRMVLTPAPREIKGSIFILPAAGCRKKVRGSFGITVSVACLSALFDAELIQKLFQKSSILSCHDRGIQRCRVLSLGAVASFMEKAILNRQNSRPLPITLS